MAARAFAVALIGTTGAAAVVWTLFAPTEIDQSEVEAGTLAEMSAAPSDDLDCAGGLKAEVGAAQHCTLTRDGEKFSVDLTVTDADGANIRWNTVVAGDPQTGRRVSAAELERHTFQILAQERPVDAVRCQGPLPAIDAATQACTMRAGSAEHRVETKVTVVEPNRVQWSVTVID